MSVHGWFVLLFVVVVWLGVTCSIWGDFFKGRWHLVVFIDNYTLGNKLLKGRSYDPKPEPYPQKWSADLGAQKVLLITPTFHYINTRIQAT